LLKVESEPRTNPRSGYRSLISMYWKVTFWKSRLSAFS